MIERREPLCVFGRRIGNDRLNKLPSVFSIGQINHSPTAFGIWRCYGDKFTAGILREARFHQRVFLNVCDCVANSNRLLR